MCHKPTKESAMKDKKGVSALTSDERRTNVTAVVCTSATGEFIPPMPIIPRVRFLKELINKAPTGKIGRATNRVGSTPKYSMNGSITLSTDWSCATRFADSGWSQQSHKEFGTHPQSKREERHICLPTFSLYPQISAVRRRSVQQSE